MAMTNHREGCERRILDIRVKRERRKFDRRLEDQAQAQRNFKWAFVGMLVSFLGLFLYIAVR